VKVTVTDKKLVVHEPAQFVRNGIIRYPRGAIIRYEATNKGTRAYAFKVWDSVTRVMRPRGNDSVLINWNYRGRFVYRTLFRGKPFGPKGVIEVY
jgi:hypothetical protein